MPTQLGCFGSVLYYDVGGRRCGACPHFQQCGEQVVVNKASLESWYADLVKSNKESRSTRKMVALTNEPVALPTTQPDTISSKTATRVSVAATSNLSKKPAEFIDRWNSKSIDYLAYKTGVNGFTYCGNKFATVAMQFFMDNPAGVTKGELTDELIAKAGGRGPWGIGTAGSHAGIVLEAFEYLGIITLSGGKAYLR